VVLSLVSQYDKMGMDEIQKEISSGFLPIFECSQKLYYLSSLPRNLQGRFTAPGYDRKRQIIQRISQGRRRLKGNFNGVNAVCYLHCISHVN